MHGVLRQVPSVWHLEAKPSRVCGIVFTDLTTRHLSSSGRRLITLPRDAITSRMTLARSRLSSSATDSRCVPCANRLVPDQCILLCRPQAQFVQHPHWYSSSATLLQISILGLRWPVLPPQDALGLWKTRFRARFVDSRACTRSTLAGIGPLTTSKRYSKESLMLRWLPPFESITVRVSTVLMGVHVHVTAAGNRRDA
jgi:hypothetical protein